MKDDFKHTLKFGFECMKRTYVSNFNGKAVPCNCSLKPYRKFAIICSVLNSICTFDADRVL